MPPDEPDAITLGDRVDAADGFVSIRPAPGWSVTTTSDELGVFHEPGDEASTWEPSGSAVDTMLILESEELGEVEVSINREARFANLDSFDRWVDGTVDAIGLESPQRSTRTWAGASGTTVSGEGPAGWVRIDAVPVDDQVVFAITRAPEPNLEQIAQIEAMLDSVVVDITVVGPLQHRRTVGGLERPSDEETFVVNVAIPVDWTFDGGGFLVWRPQDSAPDDGTFVQMSLDPTGGDLAERMEQEFRLITDEWLQEAPVVDPRMIDDVPATVYWEGEPSDADAAVVMLGDGRSFAAIYLAIPDDQELLTAMVDSIVVEITAES